MSIFSIVLISIYIGLSLLPIIYNHIMTKSSVVKESHIKSSSNRPSKDNILSPGNNRSLIVFLNNLSDDQINYILNQLRHFNSIKEQFQKREQN